MFVDKTLSCKDCGREFVFSVSEQEFYAEKDLPTNQVAARSAGQPERPRPDRPEAAMTGGPGRCTQRFVPLAEKKPLYRSSPAGINRYTAGIATSREITVTGRPGA